MNILQINGSARREGANSTRIADSIVARLKAQHPAATGEPASSSVLDQPPTTPATQISVVVMGDSHSVGDPSVTWVGAASAQLGWGPVVNLSAPGRGFAYR